jgi:stage V sporulation protein B
MSSPAPADPPPAPSSADAPAADAPAPVDADAARSAGRGGLAIAVAKVAFILFGFAQQLILPRIVGVDGYGQVRSVLTFVNIVNNVIVGTSIQSVSRTVASVAGAKADEAFRRVLAVHVIIAVVVSTAFALLAGFVASIIHAPHIAGPLRIAGAIVLLYGIYAPLVGSLNGKRRFLEQAGLDIGYGVMRLVGVVGGALAFARAGLSGVTGTIVGFASAAALIVPVALRRSKTGRAGDAGPDVKSYLAFLGPLALGQMFLNLLLSTDFLVLGYFAGQKAQAAGLPTSTADTLRGVYGGVQLFEFLPYQLLLSVTFILFPMLAKAHAEKDAEAVRRYTMTGIRIALVVTGLLCATVGGLAPHLLRVAYPAAIADQGGTALRILTPGMAALSLLGISCAALTSLGRERVSAGLTALTVGYVALGCFLALPSAPLGPEMLERTAVATSSALTAAAVVAAVMLHRAAGGYVAVASLVRVLAAGAVTIALGTRLPWLGKPVAIVEAAAVAGVYLALLVLTGEIGKADLAAVKAVAARRKRA